MRMNHHFSMMSGSWSIASHLSVGILYSPIEARMNFVERSWNLVVQCSKISCMFRAFVHWPFNQKEDSAHIGVQWTHCSGHWTHSILYNIYYVWKVLFSGRQQRNNVECGIRANTTNTKAQHKADVCRLPSVRCLMFILFFGHDRQATRLCVWSFWPALYHLVDSVLPACLMSLFWASLQTKLDSGDRWVSCTKTQISAVSCMQSRSLVRCCLLLHSVLVLLFLPHFSPCQHVHSTRSLCCDVHRCSTGCSWKRTQTEPLCVRKMWPLRVPCSRPVYSRYTITLGVCIATFTIIS